MAKVSIKRQQAIAGDAGAIQRIYYAACEHFGQEKVDASHTLVWTERCIWGVNGRLPFGVLECQNISEVLWVLENVIGKVQTPFVPKSKKKDVPHA